ncbi:MAG: T9SS C-terminal target domain-containing protein [Calditrichaeota bacterium]|nr:MAG: T9SS C-terminal target domain-containing protein [Calditrichota bacterium]
MKKMVLISCVLWMLPGVVKSQTIIFPTLSGQELIDSLVAHYKPPFVLDYGTARDSMYAYIDNHEDSVRGVYTGYTIYVPHGAPNPRDYTNGADPIINTEHTWPRSKGATGMARRDLHHLFPTNAVANSARANLPFDESPDNLTDRWYRDTDVLENIPPNHIDEYSELDFNTRFEPREDHKGNVARAMFYFYTMYRSKADSADPTFFNLQKDILRLWNSLDPVDSAEVTRTYAVAHFQGGTVNPFVIDTTLIGRAYFGVTVGIEPGNSLKSTTFKLEQNFPNPFNPMTTIEFSLLETSKVRLVIYDLSGKEVNTLINEQLSPGNHRVQWEGRDHRGNPVASGIYFYRLIVQRANDNLTHIGTRKMVLLR